MTILFLDFDGVLHSDDNCPGRRVFFEYSDILVDILNRHSHVMIDLSVPWCDSALTLDAVKSFLPDALASKILSSVWQPGMPDAWFNLSRYDQINQHVTRYQITNWVAINSCSGWTADRAYRLVHTDPCRALNDMAVQVDLDKKLDGILKMKIRTDSRFDIWFRRVFGISIVAAGTKMTIGQGFIVKSCTIVDTIPVDPPHEILISLFFYQQWVLRNIDFLDDAAKLSFARTADTFETDEPYTE